MFHELQYGAKCHVRYCNNIKVNPSQACEEHQSLWRKHVQHCSCAALAGIKRMLQRPGETMPWQTETRGTGIEAHDEETCPRNKISHFFSPARFYCVETACAPCGAVIAWAKFSKSESETNILKFLEDIYYNRPRPAYVCIDKACKVLRTSIANGSWIEWQKTTRFIVDTYHYINHRISDILCHTWCNPSPLNGSAPNLVVRATNKDGVSYFKRAFNTQVSPCTVSYKILLTCLNRHVNN